MSSYQYPRLNKAFLVYGDYGYNSLKNIEYLLILS